MAYMPYKFKHGNIIIEVPKVNELIKKSDITWANVLNKPSSFTPSSHNHDWSSITGKPSSFAPSSHTHGYLPLAGGTLTGNVFFNGGGVNFGAAGSYAELKSSAGVQFNSAGKVIYFEANIDPNAFRPGGNYSNQINIGTAAAKFRGFYGTYNGISSSDRSIKKNIETLDERYEQLFMKLVPVRYMMKLKGSDRYHTGFIAQDIEESMTEVGLSSLDFAGFCKDRKQQITKDEFGHEIFRDKVLEDGEDPYEYALRYADFVSLNTHMIQKSITRITSQQKEINDLKKQVQELKNLIKNEN